MLLVTDSINLWVRASLANYSASKGGVLAFTRGLALELARHNITVNSICPGWIKTDMTERIPEKLKDGILSSIPLKKFGEPEDISDMVYYLTLKKICLKV